MMCPCGSLLPYEKCCAPFILGKETPKTPLQLMRSRYTAFTKADVEYLQKTMEGKQLENFDPKKTKHWAQQVEWLGLEIVKTHQNQVEFIARYKEHGNIHEIHECSDFLRRGDRWVYIGGQHLN